MKTLTTTLIAAVALTLSVTASSAQSTVSTHTVQSSASVTPVSSQVVATTTSVSFKNSPGVNLRLHSSVKNSHQLLTKGLATALTMAPNQAPKLVIVVGKDNAWLTEQVLRLDKELNSNEVTNFIRETQNLNMNTEWAYSLRGENLQLILVNPYTSDIERTTISMLREVGETLVGWNGGHTMGYPCWAAEGLGKPVAFAAFARITGGNADKLLRDWVASTPVRATVDSYKAAEQFNGDCKNRGVGHAHGGWLSSILVKKHGVKGVIAWVNATKGAPNWRVVFKEHFGMSVKKAYVLSSQSFPSDAR